MAIERKEALAYRTALAETGRGELIPNPGNGQPHTAPTKTIVKSISLESSEPLEFEDDGVPEIVIMHARDSSKDTLDSFPQDRRKLSHSHGRSKAGGRRLSHSIFGAASSRPDRQKRWKTGSLMLGHLGSKDGK